MRRFTCLTAAAAVLCLVVVPAASLAAEASGTVTSVANGNVVLDDDNSVGYAITSDTEIVGASAARDLVGKSVVVTFDDSASPPVASRVEVTS